MSMAKGEIPTSLKKALVRPLIKKPCLDRDMPKNYRPVSNLPLLSKLTEEAVAAHLSRHLDTQNMLEPQQSTYRKYHSMKKPLVRICSDIITALDNRQGTLLGPLEVSSALIRHN